jgi:tetratricopeptide (TPR) repeat protein
VLSDTTPTFAARDSELRPAVSARLAGGAFVLIAFALALVPLEDPDAWTHLALGREYVRVGSLLATEPFSFPSLGMPYLNAEWLFQVGLYLIHAATGVTGVVVAKAIVAALLFWVLWKDSRPTGEAEADRPLFLLIRAAVLLATLWMVRYRFVERPDLVMMLFLALTIWSLNAWLASGSRLLFALPLVQVVWANVHPSTIVALVPFGAVLGGGLAMLAWDRWRGVASPTTPPPRRLAVVAAVLVAVATASLLTPNALHALKAPLAFADLTWHRHEIHELQPLRFWSEPEPFVMAGLLGVSLALTARRALMSVLLAVPFVYVGLSARRFVFMMAVVAGPILARHLCLSAGPLSAAWARRATRAAGAALVAAAAVLVLTVAPWGPLTDPIKRPGVGADVSRLPEGALRYLDANGIEGRLFNTFGWGGYIEWRDFPRRVPIVDGRLYLPPGLTEEIHFARVHARHLDRLQAAYGFDVAVVIYPDYPAGGADDAGGAIDLGLTSPQWALVYWDDVGLVYLRRTERFASLIERDAYRHVRPANGPLHLRRLLGDRQVAPAVLAELDRNARETGSTLSALLHGYAALELGAWDDAIRRLEGLSGGRWQLDTWQGLAAAYWRKGDRRRAISYYQRILAVSEQDWVLYNVGLAHAESGDLRAAARALERARGRNPFFAPLYPTLMDVYRRLGDAEAERALGPDFLRAASRQQADEYVRGALALQRDGRAAEALGELTRALAADPDHVRARSELGNALLAAGRLDEALAQHQSALKSNPRFGRAHLDLALVYTRLGDAQAARRHLETYVRLEPRTYAAWQARQQLARLGR